MEKSEFKFISANQRRWRFLILGLVSLAAFLPLSAQFGCCCRLKNIRNAAFIHPVPTVEREAEEGPETELVLNVDERVEKISLSPNLKRMVIETRIGDLASGGLYHDSDQQNLPLRVELWNVEFADARPEIFSNENKFLIKSYSNAVAFDEEGDRIFWIDQETRGLLAQSPSYYLQNSVVRGASLEEAPSPDEYVSNVSPETSSLRPLPLYLPWDDAGNSSATERQLETSARTDRLPHDSSISETDDTTTLPSAESAILNDADPAVPDQSTELVSSSQIDNPKLEGDNLPLSTCELSPSEKKAEATNYDILSDETPFAKTQTPDIEQDSEQQSDVVFVNTPDLEDFREPEQVEKPEINVVMTKPLESERFILMNSEGVDEANSDIKHMKTAVETKNAEVVWISPNSKWLVCNASNDHAQGVEFNASSAEKPVEESDKDAQVAPSEAKTTNDEANTGKESPTSDPWSRDWALVPVRDRKRVVRFPETVKMTFDSATSNEEIQGRVVDVLAVSDAEDLVATLVMEMVENTSQEPRFKIVIWDLNVALTVNLDKAILPLRALEVSQIAIPYPIARRYCKFSPSGKSFAARIDPKYISVWQSTNGRPIVDLGENPGVVQDFEFSPGETRMAVGVGGPSAQVVVWEIRKGIPCLYLDNLPLDVKSIDAVAFSRNERFVYFANDIGEIRRWDIRPKVKLFD